MKQKKDRGLVFNPNIDMCKVYAQPDANFSGMHGHEEHTDPACVKSLTIFIVTFSYCPFLWFSKLQAETALSTMEAEIISMAHCCRELFPIINITTSLGKAVVLPMGDTTMNVSVH